MPGQGDNVTGIVSFNVMPPHFDVITASPEDLALYAIPPRPDPASDPAGHTRWARQFPEGFKVIEPELRQHRPDWRRRPLSVISAAELTSDHWSGAVIFPPAGKTFMRVTGSWRVPPVWVPSSWPAGPANFAASFWVGIDGGPNVESNDVLQAGVTASTSGPSDTPQYWLWFEWFPNGSTESTTSASCRETSSMSTSQPLAPQRRQP